MAISEIRRASPLHGSGSAARALVAIVSTAVTGWLLIQVARAVRGSASAPWTLGRASGLTSYGLLVLLVSAGLLLSHPTVRRVGRPSQLTRIRLHAALAVFTLVFTVLHVVVLATDPWAHVGWPGALLPTASPYRPVGVTLGVVAGWSGLVTGLTAALAGRAVGRIWWPVHKVAGIAFLLVWAHGMTTGSDSAALRGVYLASGGAVLVLALSRYQASTLDDLRDELTIESPVWSPKGVPDAAEQLDEA